MSTKFVKFQRPVDFDTKLSYVKRLLDDVDQRIHLVDLTSIDLNSVETKFEHCTVSNGTYFILYFARETEVTGNWLISDWLSVCTCMSVWSVITE